MPDLRLTTLCLHQDACYVDLTFGAQAIGRSQCMFVAPTQAALLNPRNLLEAGPQKSSARREQGA
mgnify:CR=1 FL=1